MTKYSRYQSVINRNADEEIDENHWLKQFQNKLEREAVQSKSNQSVFEQITSIMNSKSKYPSVEAAVEDMKERSGLKAYLENKLSNDKKLPKTASDENNAIHKQIDLPIVIKKYPPIKSTIENYIKDTKGNLPIPAIIDKIKSIHKSDVSHAEDWEDEKLVRLVSALNLKAKKDNPAILDNPGNLGTLDVLDDSEIDPSNTDAFYALNPAKF